MRHIKTFSAHNEALEYGTVLPHREAKEGEDLYEKMRWQFVDLTDQGFNLRVTHTPDEGPSELSVLFKYSGPDIKRAPRGGSIQGIIQRGKDKPIGMRLSTSNTKFDRPFEEYAREMGWLDIIQSRGQMLMDDLGYETCEFTITIWFNYTGTAHGGTDSTSISINFFNHE